MNSANPDSGSRAEREGSTSPRIVTLEPESSRAPLTRWIQRLGGNRSELTPLSSRERLLESGWAAAADLPLAKAFAGIPSASVAELAGLTTGSFFHHFSNSAEFSDAMALAFLEDDAHEANPLSDVVESLEFIDLIELIRSALSDTWSRGTEGNEPLSRFRCQMRLWSFHQAQLSSPTDGYSTVAEILRQTYRVREDQALVVWRAALARSGRELLNPFSLPKVATSITALYEGLMLRSAVDPDAVDSDLFSEVAAAIADSLTGPAGVKAQFEDGTVLLSGQEVLSPQARSGARRRQMNWLRIVGACSGMFGNGWETVSATEVADRAGVSAQTVLNLFHSVRKVAAATFTAHANEIYSFALDYDGGDPLDGLKETLTALSLRTGADPEAARALLAERVAANLHRGQSMSDMDIRIEVPVGAAVGLWISRLGIGGDRGTALASILSNFVLGATLAGDFETGEIVEMAIRLLPPEAQLGTSAEPVVT